MLVPFVTTLSTLGVVLLLLFGAMFQRGAISFQIASIKQGWDTSQKATACYMGAVIYGVTLLVSVAYQIHVRKKLAASKL